MNKSIIKNYIPFQINSIKGSSLKNKISRNNKLPIDLFSSLNKITKFNAISDNGDIVKNPEIFIQKFAQCEKNNGMSFILFSSENTEVWLGEQGFGVLSFDIKPKTFRINKVKKHKHWNEIVTDPNTSKENKMHFFKKIMQENILNMRNTDEEYFKVLKLLEKINSNIDEKDKYLEKKFKTFSYVYSVYLLNIKEYTQKSIFDILESEKSKKNYDFNWSGGAFLLKQNEIEKFGTKNIHKEIVRTQALWNFAYEINNLNNSLSEVALTSLGVSIKNHLSRIEGIKNSMASSKENDIIDSFVKSTNVKKVYNDAESTIEFKKVYATKMKNKQKSFLLSIRFVILQIFTATSLVVSLFSLLKNNIVLYIGIPIMALLITILSIIVYKYERNR